MQVSYVNRAKIDPAFGMCYPDGRIEIREDLPQVVKNFLVIHEMYHLTDIEIVWWKRELKANWAGFSNHPAGGIVALIMSLSPYRLKFYFQRWRNGR
jgi:hypothetical protein